MPVLTVAAEKMILSLEAFTVSEWKSLQNNAFAALIGRSGIKHINLRNCPQAETHLPFIVPQTAVSLVLPTSRSVLPEVVRDLCNGRKLKSVELVGADERHYDVFGDSDTIEQLVLERCGSILEPQAKRLTKAPRLSGLLIRDSYVSNEALRVLVSNGVIENIRLESVDGFNGIAWSALVTSKSVKRAAFVDCRQFGDFSTVLATEAAASLLSAVVFQGLSALNDADIKKLCELPSVSEVILVGCDSLGPASFDCLATNLKLRLLEIQQAPLLSNNGANALASIKGLERLVLRGCNITEIHVVSGSIRSIELLDCHKLKHVKCEFEVAPEIVTISRCRELDSEDLLEFRLKSPGTWLRLDMRAAVEILLATKSDEGIERLCIVR